MAEQATEAVAPVPGTPEYDAAMAAKVDESAAKAAESANPQEIKPQKPDNVPDEFWDAEKGEINTEALLKAATESKDKPADAPAKEGAEGDQEDPEKAAKEAVEAKGFSYDALQQEFDTQGKLSDESYKKLEDMGFPREVVDSHIAGRQALNEQRNSKAFEAAGGTENYTRIIEWAKTGLKGDEVEAFNKAVVGSEAEMLQAVHGLRARYEQEYGRQPNLLGGAPANANGSGYASRQEMVTDMRDPRYEKDPAYRQRVQAKIAATTAF